MESSCKHAQPHTSTPELPPASLPSAPPLPPPLDRWRAEHGPLLLLPVITPSFPACAKYDKKSFGKNPNLQFVGRALQPAAGTSLKPSFVSGMVETPTQHG